MEELRNRFQQAKDAYFQLISEDFPDFDMDEYIKEEAAEAVSVLNSPEEAPALEASKEEEKRPKKKILSALDFSKDGKLGLHDVAFAAVRAKKTAVSAAKGAGKAAAAAAQSAGGAIKEIDARDVFSNAQEAVKDAGKAIGDVKISDIAATTSKIGKTAVGVQGIQNRSAAHRIQKICGEYYDAAEEITERHRLKLNHAIEEFGEYRLHSLHQTVGRFLQYLQELEQKNAVKEYEILLGAEINTQQLDEMERVDMAASEALRTTAITGAYGTVAVLGTPVLVTTSVGALATASTGTAISSLTGAAATNATMAWLGGGSLAAGGGGMAAGATTLAAITAGATATMALLAAGTMVSLHYGKKLTEAKEYEKDVGVTVASLEKAWVVMDGISRRTAELREATEELKWRTLGILDELKPLVASFDFKDETQVKVFNQCALLIKTMVELAQTPLLDSDGNLSTESMQIAGKVTKVLNTEV